MENVRRLIATVTSTAPTQSIFLFSASVLAGSGGIAKYPPITGMTLKAAYMKYRCCHPRLRNDQQNIRLTTERLYALSKIGDYTSQNMSYRSANWRSNPQSRKSHSPPWLAAKVDSDNTETCWTGDGQSQTGNSADHTERNTCLGVRLSYRNICGLS
jgi:hypothetical protein